MAEIEGFFKGSGEWLFLAGHFISSLYNEDSSVDVTFGASEVNVTAGGATKTLTKTNGFNLHRSAKIIFWGGCNVHSRKGTVSKLRTLFGNPVMIGWKSITGYQILNVMMGAYGNTSPSPGLDFFDRVKDDPKDVQHVMEAWKGAAEDAFWGDRKPAFSMIAADGTVTDF